MAINLLNDKELNNYLIDLVWGQDGMPRILDGNSQSNLADIKYIEGNKDTIVRSILTQYMKHRIRAYLTDNENQAFLTPVSIREDLPDWAVRNIENGQKVFEFDAMKMTEDMRRDLITIRDFLYSVAESYVDKAVITAKESKKNPKIRLDYLKTSNEYDTFEKVFSAAEKWHKNMQELAVKKAKNEKMYKESLLGTNFIMDLPNGMKAYQLITPEALDYESEYMGHCVGKGAYDKGVTDGSIKIYSIRDADGEPHATIEVRDKDVYQCKGKGNKTPVQRYIPAVQKFIESQNFEIQHDMKNIGLIKQGGKYYSIYDLPDGFVVNGDLDLSDMDLSGINLNISVTGELNLAGAKNLKLPPVADFRKMRGLVLSSINLSGVHAIKWPSEYIILTNVENLPSILDFSKTKLVNLENVNLSGVSEIKFPKENIILRSVQNLPSVLDFSGTSFVDFAWMDLSGVSEIKWSKEEARIVDAANFPPVLDFSKTKKVNLESVYLSNVREIKSPIENFSLKDIEDLPQVLDFSRTKMVDLADADLSNVREIKWPSEKIYLNHAKNLPSVLDFSGVKAVDLSSVDLLNVREIKWPSKEISGLNSTKNLPSVLDFSHTDEVNLSEADLSMVRKIKWPIEKVLGDYCLANWPQHIQKSYKYWKGSLAIKNAVKNQVQDMGTKIQQIFMDRN